MNELLTQLDSDTIRQAKDFRIVNPDHTLVEQMSSELQSTVFGQEKAMTQLASAVLRSKAGFSDPRRPEMVAMFLGPTGVGKCLHGKTLIYDPIDKTTKTVKQRHKEGKPFNVYSLDANNNIIITKANPPERFTKQKMWEVSFSNGYTLTATHGHRFFLGNGYSDVATLQQRLLSGEQVHLPSISEHDLEGLPVNVQRLNQKALNFQGGYHSLFRLYGQLLQKVKDSVLDFFLLLIDVGELSLAYSQRGVGASKLKYNHQRLFVAHHATLGFFLLVSNKIVDVLQRLLLLIYSQLFGVCYQPAWRFASGLTPLYKELYNMQPVSYPNSSLDLVDLPPYTHYTKVDAIKAIGKSYYYDFAVPETKNYWAQGVFNHNTEAGKALSKFLYGREWEQRFLRIDCTQLQEGHSVGRLKGSEPSYVGYGDNNILITPDFLNRGGVIIFDEIEKAHPMIWRWLLPVMEEGQQKALVPKREGSWQSELSTLQFNNTYIIMTANVGAEALHRARAGNQGIGFHLSTSKPDMESIGMSELGKAFRDMPEFLGRIDASVVFEDLGRPQFEKILYKFLGEINDDQRYGQNYLAVTKELRDFIIDHAETGLYGAREIRHKLDQYVVTKAAEIKSSGVLPNGAFLVGDVARAEDVDEKIQLGDVIFWTNNIEEAPPVVALTKIEEPEPTPEYEPEPVTPEEEQEEINEDLPIKSQRPRRPKKPTFFLPDIDSGTTIDIAVTVKQKGKKELVQLMTNIPLIETEEE